ncbi:hypothetical protein HGM15179_012666 [Zosterops borbonicus]|uniref:Uncharacterized protein n=1 Tax=Zosterops borbonicus TaxID=364589 RepID=A0A8K1LI26_9PASS|nr:hypothetical protein HGM15179_012666 [Zosterops borbonicus]
METLILEQEILQKAANIILEGLTELPLALAFGGLASNPTHVSRAYRLKEEECDSFAKQDNNIFEGSVEKCELKRSFGQIVSTYGEECDSAKEASQKPCKDEMLMAETSLQPGEGEQEDSPLGFRRSKFNSLICIRPSKLHLLAAKILGCSGQVYFAQKIPPGPEKPIPSGSFAKLMCVKQQLLDLAAAQFPFRSNLTKAALQSLSASEGKVNALLVP